MLLEVPTADGAVTSSGREALSCRGRTVQPAEPPTPDSEGLVAAAAAASVPSDSSSSLTEGPGLLLLWLCGSERPRLSGWDDLVSGSWWSERSLSECERHSLLCLCLLKGTEGGC